MTGFYFASMAALAKVSDFGLGGSTARGGPSGVADAVNQTAVAVLLPCSARNLVLTEACLALVPQRI